MNKHDLIIIGAGPVGLASALQCSKRGLKVLVIEQFEINNQFSSSAGNSRQFRVQYSEDYMTNLALESIQYWDELQTVSDEMLRTKVGSLWFGVQDSNSSEGAIHAAMLTMDKLNIPYQEMSAREIEATYHFKGLPNSYIGFLQKDGGTINVPATISTLKNECIKSGKVTFATNERVVDIQSGLDLTVVTDKGKYVAMKLLSTAGPYTNQLLDRRQRKLGFDIWQMVSAYFKIKDTTRDLPSWFVYEEMTDDDDGFYYGFENCSWSNPGFLRIAPAFAKDVFLDPADRKPKPNKTDMDLTVAWVKKRLPFVDPTPHHVTTCLASIPLDSEKKMFLDFIPDQNSDTTILLFSSGWAFKFVPLLGKICADLLIEGSTQYDISHFGIIEGPEIEHKLSSIKRNRRLPF